MSKHVGVFGAIFPTIMFANLRARPCHQHDGADSQLDLAFMCVRAPNAFDMECSGVAPPQTPNAFTCVSPNAFICVSPNAFICVSPNAFAEIRNGARFARLPVACFARYVF